MCPNHSSPSSRQLRRFEEEIERGVEKVKYFFIANGKQLPSFGDANTCPT